MKTKTPRKTKNETRQDRDQDAQEVQRYHERYYGDSRFRASDILEDLADRAQEYNTDV